jgi:two-component sensor histidine kinase
MVTRAAVPSFLEGGGEMGDLIRAFDWSATPLGRPETWPQSLRTTVRLMLNSRHPMFIWWGPELIQLYNDGYRATMGPEMHPATLGARGRESWASIWPIIGPQIEYVMAGKGSTWNVEQMVPIHRHGRVEDVWWTYGYSPIDLEDHVGGVLVVCTDVTEQHLQREALRAAEEHLKLVNAELQHRVRNMFATLAAVARQTLRGETSDSALRDFEGRLSAFAKAHGALAAGSQNSGFIRELIDNAVRPHAAEPEQVTLDGPRIEIGAKPAVALVLAMHEMATNAVKYGALSRRRGRVSVTWKVEGPDLHLEWREKNGPPVSPPERTGFGSRLIHGVLSSELGGNAAIAYEREGVVLTLMAPAERLRAEPDPPFGEEPR